MKHTIKWIGAIAFSLVAHASGAMYLASSTPEQAQDLIAGGAEVEVAILGDAFEETLQSGEPTEVVEPTEDVPDEVKPEEIAPIEDVTSTTPEITAEQPHDLIATEADVILPAEQVPTLQVAEAVVTASVAPVETIVPEEKPEIQEPKKEKVEKPEPKKEPVKKKKVTRKKTGDKGEQAQSQVKGKLDGDVNGNSAAATGKNRSSTIGNADVSNYSGKVRNKVMRKHRYPSQANRQGITGTATVSFVVTADGGLSNLRLAGSSGSPILDQAALETVQRAAPFPPIPANAGRNSWPFSLPIAYNPR
ncbi:energy transducer TonB [Sinorhizobium sp. A49]|uniref:energy transducer TonB family protein n=1 Tax=Sinorhizobium sp. A49 TaxID=1945861 RepID=UPI000985B8D6|nr:energy transducer TonB [Sinorhizobium sp. A49]OOG67772.1 energy transducer TonB [Sinorhizobium sp. A49]